MIRPFRPADAPAAAVLLRPLSPTWIITERGLLHWIESAPERSRTAVWVAERDGDLVGFGEAFFEWEKSAGDVAALWVGVREDARRNGIGSALWDAAEEHVSSARRLELWTDGDRDGERFLLARRFRKTRSEQCWSLDPGAFDVAAIDAYEQEKRAEGFRLASLAELDGRERDLHALYAEAAADVPADDPHDDVRYEDWRRTTLEHPDLDREGSFVVLAGDHPVSFAWLIVDREGGRAVHEMTGTARAFRGRGLARLAKLATIRSAAENGIAALTTENDSENAPMLALNERLGYRPTSTRTLFASER